MTPARKTALQALGYFAFFLFVFLVSLYALFDANSLRPLIENAAENSSPWFKGKNVSIDRVELHRLYGLDLRGVKIESVGDEEIPALDIDRIVLSPSLFSLPGLISPPEKRPPDIDLDYAVYIAGGLIEGEVESNEKSFFLETSVEKPLMLAKLSVPSARMKNTRLNGSLEGNVKLDYKDLKAPDTFSGEINLGLEKVRIENIEYSLFKIDRVSADEGTLAAELEGPTIKINTLKLQSDDIPASLIGTMTLNNPWQRSMLDINGSIELSDDFKERNPILQNVPFGSKNYKYNGPLDNLVPGLF